MGMVIYFGFNFAHCGRLLREVDVRMGDGQIQVGSVVVLDNHGYRCAMIWQEDA